MPCPDFMMIFTGLGREKWKMRAHEKKHKKYQCDKCDRSFEYQYIFKKHKLVNHEDTKLYCHFFNNKQTCPYNDKCIFLHADSKFCRYDLNCERDYCMFKHRRNSLNRLSFRRIVMRSLISMTLKVYLAMLRMIQRMIKVKQSINETFHNPSQTINNTVENKFNWEKCDYYAATKPKLFNHKKEVHNRCTFCFSNFSDQDNLKDCILANHTEWLEMTGLNQERVQDKQLICFWLNPCVSIFFIDTDINLIN